MARGKEFDREVVLDRAMRLFWRQGYEATSMQELVDVMGIGRGSLYATFGGKHALFLEALDRYCEIVAAPLFAPLDEPGPAKDAIRRVFEQVIQQAVADGPQGCLMVNVSAELAPHDPQTRRRAEANLEGGEEKLYHVLQRGRETGEIGTRQEPRALARCLFNTLQGLRITAKVNTDRELLDDIARVTLAVLD